MNIYCNLIIMRKLRQVMFRVAARPPQNRKPMYNRIVHYRQYFHRTNVSGAGPTPPGRLAHLSITARLLRITLLLCIALLTGCSSQNDISATETLQAAITHSAETVVAQVTLAAGETAIAQLTANAEQTEPTDIPSSTPLPLVSTATSRPYRPAVISTRSPTEYPTASPTADLVSVPSATPVPAELPTATAVLLPTAGAPTPLPADCNRMEWLGDVTIPPDTIFFPGSTFTKIWRVRNTGSCIWDSGYSLTFTGGNLLSPAGFFFMPYAVNPGQTVDLSATLVAPAAINVYQSTWMLRSSQGEVFGYGALKNQPLLVSIRTYRPAVVQDYTYDLTTYACAGTWRSSRGPLACPGVQDDRNGFVIPIDNPELESLALSGYGLWMHPSRDQNGWVSGELPPYTVQAGDHFIANLGCLADRAGCDVTFQLDYRLPDGSRGMLGRWREIYDGVLTPVDIDLSLLGGRVVTFILTANDNGAPRQADAVWLLPHIQRGQPTDTYALVWTREGYPLVSDCNTLRIRFTGPLTAVAQAFDCAAGNAEIGRRNLSTDQVTTLWNWMQRLAIFEGEIYTVTGNHPVTSWIDFRGIGTGVAGESEIRALNSFAAQVWVQVTASR